MDFLHTTSQSDLGVFALGLLIAGAVSGLAAGVLGVGGGIVIVPVLYHVMTALGVAESVRMHVAIGTSLAALIPVALTRAQNAKREIDHAIVRRWALPLLIGVAGGSTAAAFSSGRVLALIFAGLAAVVAIRLAFEGKENPAGPPFDNSYSHALPLFSGFASALSGLSTHTVMAPLKRLLRPEPLSIGTVSILTLVAAIAATLGAAAAGWNVPDLPPDSLGYVNLLGFALIAPVLVATEPAGAALAHLIDARRLRLVFTGLVAISTARLLWDAFA